MATITINMSAAAATRVSKALQYAKGLGAPATREEVKDYIITDLKQIIRNAERRMAVEAAKDGTEPTIT